MYMQNYKLDVTSTIVNIPNFVYDKDNTTNNYNAHCFDANISIM
jgi:hypothetical protein